MIEPAEAHDQALEELADLGVEPQRGWVRAGYLDELARRVEWSARHPQMFEGRRG